MLPLVLPYPISANVYWRTTVIAGRPSTYVSPEAKAYKEAVGWTAKAAGVRKPIEGRVALTIALYPGRPLDAERRMRKRGDAWDDTVACIDLDNALKVLIDAIKDVVIADDKWVRRITAERFEPDGKARVVLLVEPYVRSSVEQLSLDMALSGGAAIVAMPATDDLWSGTPIARAV